MTLTQPLPAETTFDEELSYDATVPRELVHKQSVHEVLLTDARQVNDDVFVCAGELPRTHSFYSDGFYNDGVSIRYDAMLPMELKRQAAVLIAHRWLEVPGDWRFVFAGIDMKVGHPEALAVGGAPARVLVTLTVARRLLHEGTLVGFKAEAAFSIDGIEACTAKGRVMFMPRPFYEAMRTSQREGHGLSPEPPERCAGRRFPVAPELLGRMNECNVVLSGLCRDENKYEADVVVDDRHPCLFDHRLDHVPGMLLIEAHRQIAVAAAADRIKVAPSRLIVTRTASKFDSFAELDLSLTCEAIVSAGDEPDEEIAVTTAIIQNGTTISNGRLGFAVAE
jgi:hypothetical protein